MNQIKINDQNFLADDRLKGFDLQKKASTYIDVYGLNSSTKELFVQFMDGYAVIYDQLTPAMVEELKTAESVGKFVIALKKKIAARHVGNKLVRLAAPEIVLLKNDIIGHKNNVYGRKHEEVEIVSTGSSTFIVKNKKGEKFPVGSDEVLYKTNS